MSSVSTVMIIRIAVLAILALFVVIGCLRGFLKMVLSLVSIILSLILVSLLNPAVTSALDKATPLRKTVTSAVESVVLEKAASALKDIAGDSLPEGYGTGVFPVGERAATKAILADVPLNEEQQQKILDMANLPETFTKKVTFSAQESALQFVNQLSNIAADIVLQALAMIITFVVVLVIIRVLCIVLGLISKLPVLHSFDKLLGGLLGFWEGLMVLWLACVVISLVAPTGIGETLTSAISSDPVLSRLYGLAVSLGKL